MSLELALQLVLQLSLLALPFLSLFKLELVSIALPWQLLMLEVFLRGLCVWLLPLLCAFILLIHMPFGELLLQQEDVRAPQQFSWPPLQRVFLPQLLQPAFVPQGYAELPLKPFLPLQLFLELLPRPFLPLQQFLQLLLMLSLPLQQPF